MQSKKMIVAPSINPSEIMRLRAHIDGDHVCGGDLSVSVNYEANWEDEGGKVLEDLPDSRVNACGPYFRIEGGTFILDEDPKE